VVAGDARRCAGGRMGGVRGGCQSGKGRGQLHGSSGKVCVFQCVRENLTEILSENL
jgi:hypothetical protein